MSKGGIIAVVVAIIFISFCISSCDSGSNSGSKSGGSSDYTVYDAMDWLNEKGGGPW